MRQKLTPDSRRPGRFALMLIEVICATVIAGTLLASVLAAARQQSRQIKTAQIRLEACEVLDSLMSRWSRGSGIPTPVTAADVPGKADWTYSVDYGVTTTIYDVPMQTVRVGVWPSGDANQGADQALVTSIELLVTPRGLAN